MLFLYFALSLLLASAGAAPTTPPTSPKTSPKTSGNTTPTKPEPVPPYMTVEGCKALMDPAKAKKALFWSGCGLQAKKAVTDKQNYAYLAGYEVMRGVFKQPWPKDHEAFLDKFKTQKAENEIYIMMPGKDGSKGVDWGNRATSHWAQHEYPIICKSTSVTKLYRLSAKDPKVKEDITDLMLAQRKAGTCPPLSKVAGGGEDD
ncbi:hypothetical protein KVR01_005916 [Diaporthe batatas]|uniref:uncharacterized protein n=1 Tax=Diaporthe batatas TaxID=748121 RepID=UPI001D04D70D|nr:uncharacterized protein KVR01_005916 [Diaporthe batatas]KAG8163998.1 hypothetical protein KVR01_005916 [Diaporthe batatas]